jgi:hypothetical protein
LSTAPPKSAGKSAATFVLSTGFEPAISAVKEQRLDQFAYKSFFWIYLSEDRLKIKN